MFQQQYPTSFTAFKNNKNLDKYEIRNFFVCYAQARRSASATPDVGNPSDPQNRRHSDVASDGVQHNKIRAAGPISQKSADIASQYQEPIGGVQQPSKQSMQQQAKPQQTSRWGTPSAQTFPGATRQSMIPPRQAPRRGRPPKRA